MHALVRTNAVAIAGVDADGDDEPIEPGQRQQGGTRRHPITLRDRDCGHDAVERRRQRLLRSIGALALLLRGAVLVDRVQRFEQGRLSS